MTSSHGVVRGAILASGLAALTIVSLHGADRSKPTASISVPTVRPPGPAPAGMVWIPGGEFLMGSEGTSGDKSLCSPETVADAQPVHRVHVDGFWMDQTDVTNAEFEKFVMATGYITVAERTPTKEEFPDAPPENLVAGSVVFTPPLNPVPLNDHFQWWTYVKGANWRYPEGPQSDIKGKENYPVVQVAYEDALAYAKWAGKRLPTEAEWEFAARGGLAGKTYAWGDEFKPGGKFMANTYQGQFPVKDIGQDGFAGIAPVKSLRLTAMVFTTWPAMCGNGAMTGIDPTTFSDSRRPAASHATRKVRRARLILPSPACANACKRAVHFYARTSIALAISWARAVRASRAQPPIMPASAA